MHVARSASAAGVAALFLGLVASRSGAQDESRQRPPSIRVYSLNGAIASRYVTPAIEVSEDAYVFAVSFDLDGQIQVLHPDYPGISVRILRHKQLRLPNFFAGFSGGGGRYDASGRYVSYSESRAGSANNSRGTVIALVSRAPFRLERVESDGDWNISAIRGLIEYRAPYGAAQALAAYLGAKGESIGVDYMRFASAQYPDSYASTPLYGCDLYYGGSDPGLAFRRIAVLNRVEQLQRGGQSVRILGYDFCGTPIVAYGPSQQSQRYRPRLPGDSAQIPRGRSRIPRGRSAQSEWSEPSEAAIGTFPTTFQPETPRAGEVLITAPTPNRRDPREIFNDPRGDDLVRESAERGRRPVERNAPRAETPVIGTFPPAREYPRPIFREAPVVREAPTAVYERPSSPPPIIRERPSSPPPPPPRAQSEPHPRPVADPAPPPRR